MALGGHKDADLNWKMTNDGTSPLLFAAALGNVDIVILLLQNRTIDINITDNCGVNAFWIACFHGHVRMM